MKKRWIVAAILIVIVGRQLLIDHKKHYPIQGQIIDAETHQPVQGAVVAINWFRLQWGLPGLGPKRTYYGTSDAITDARGTFTIPKYPHASHYMGVYKEGYVVWSSEKDYNPQGLMNGEKNKPRMWHRVRKGMVIELIPIRGGYFPAYDHARFVSSLSSLLMNTKFSDAIIKERILEEQEYRKFLGKDK